MLNAVLFAMMLAVPEASVATTTGQVTAATGKVFLERDGRRYRAEVRSALRPGDRLETLDGSGAGIFLFDGHSVFLGAGTSLILGGTSGGAVIRLDRGEVRATVGGPGGMVIATPSSRSQTRRGILHASATAEGSRSWAESGEAEMAPGAGVPVTIGVGQEASVGPVGGLVGPIPATGAGWSIRPDALRLAGAAADGRRLREGQIGQANDATALALQSSGQLGPVGTIPSGPEGTVPPTAETSVPPAEAGTPPAEAAPPTPTATAATDDSASQPIAFAQTGSFSAASSSSIAFSGAAGGFSAAFSSGLGSDAQQDSRNPGFPGNIHLITAASRYNLNAVHLASNDSLFPTARSYYSIGVGPPPTKQVSTSFLTGTGTTPITTPIPHFNAYLVNLTQFNIPDPATTNPNTSVVSGISGLVGANPTAPQIQNATPLTDPRAVFNNRATFALGEFALNRTGKNGNVPQIEIRRSDQDRQIIPLSPTTDKVTPNPDVSFVRQPDFKFFPEFKNGVYVPVPNSVTNPPTVGRLDLLRKAALTTLLASTLLDYSHRTGQTQFALGRTVFDVTGYHRPASTTPAQVAARTSAPGAALRAAATGKGLSSAPSLRSLGARPEATHSNTATAHAASAPATRHR